MIYSDVKTFYISSKTDSRLVRYDVIKLDADTFTVKVVDEQQHGVAQPNILIQVAQFDITRQQYIDKYDIGNRAKVRIEMAPSFEDAIHEFLLEHRNTI